MYVMDKEVRKKDNLGLGEKGKKQHRTVSIMSPPFYTGAKGEGTTRWQHMSR